ncbi:hypothetical protein F383_19775 [Gossypium arboreum]|uniref:Uncharacterized protein n=1 Tax=Gossypium arboreum TaxID=29729 RepID=A0A0B0NU63_GOSAR|nr:hypothetical protein F383_19775 [Gossypium arboreum]
MLYFGLCIIRAMRKWLNYYA